MKFWQAPNVMLSLLSVHLHALGALALKSLPRGGEPFLAHVRRKQLHQPSLARAAPPDGF